MVIGIFGYGAVGISIYKELCEKNTELYFIADSNRIERYKNEQLFINNQEFSARFSDSIICDLIIVAVKCFSLANAIIEIKKHIKKETTVLPILNGIKAYDILSKNLDCNVLYGVINVVANKRGNNVFCDKIINLQFGHKNNTIVKNDIKEIKAIFDESNLVSNIYPDMERRVWLKWMLNIGINQLSALLQINYIEMANKHNLRILEKLFREVLAVAIAYNVDLTEDDVIYQLDFCENRVLNNGYPSLALDVSNGSLGELSEFSDTLISMAKGKNIDVPYNYCFNELIKGKVENMNK